MKRHPYFALAGVYRGIRELEKFRKMVSISFRINDPHFVPIESIMQKN